jgi:Holliday junction resolvase RusA-like endonuclease
MIVVNADGRAAPKGSRIAGYSKKGKMFTRPASKFEKPWIDAVKAATQIAMRHACDDGPPYRVELEFRIARPANPRYDHPAAHDLDKLARAALDGLVVGGALCDDRHVTSMTANKRYVRAGEAPGLRAIVVSENIQVQENIRAAA